MAATTTTLRPNRSPRIRLVWIVPAIVAIAVVVLAVNLSTALPGRETLVIRNPTRAPVTVYASGADGGWLGIGTLDPGTTATFEEVADQGSVWRFRLRVGAEQVAELRRTADELSSDRWRLTIPAGAADGLSESRQPG
jgi:hypothetical protein